MLDAAGQVRAFMIGYRPRAGAVSRRWNSDPIAGCTGTAWSVLNPRPQKPVWEVKRGLPVANRVRRSMNQAKPTAMREKHQHRHIPNGETR